MKETYKSEVEAVDALVGKYRELKTEIAKVIVGQKQVVMELLMVSVSGTAVSVG